MYSVFLVDDEPIVLEGIRTKIDWEAWGFSFAGEASDGEIALSMIHEIKPDILITDIKMPFMDGLQLASAVKKTQPWIKIIILSGHDEFDYAKKAISIGIEDYLLKPFTSEEVIASLQKAAKIIDKERTQLSDISKMKEELKSRDTFLKKEFLNNLVHGEIDFSTMMQKSQELGINLLSRYYKVIISKIESKTDNLQNQQEACSRINSYSSSWEHTISYFHHSNRLIAIVKDSSQKNLDENIYNIAETIEHITAQNPDCYAVTGIGKTVEHLSMIQSSYDDAKKLVELNNYENENRILSSDDFQETSNVLMDFLESDPLVDRLKYAAKSEIPVIINEYIELIKNNPGQFNVFASYILVDLIFAVSKLIENLGGNIKEINPEILQRSFIDNAVLEEKNFIETVESVLNFAIDYRDSKKTGPYSEIILKAKKYIEENYADQNTTLTTVAEYVCLSPNHFSTIFSQRCKTTFIEYLTDVRIENAKRLLRDTDMKGYDIAYECGFSDPHYFSYIFKKITGLSPRDYKGSL
ncbi:MAG: response regulator [Treponema sp.]|nr:response regulator [Treponema sp.]